MDDKFGTLKHLLSDVILPNLNAVQSSQFEQIDANDRLEQAIEELQLNLRSQFALLNAQLTACRAEIAALQATLQAAQAQKDLAGRGRITLVH